MLSAGLNVFWARRFKYAVISALVAWAESWGFLKRDWNQAITFISPSHSQTRTSHRRAWFFEHRRRLQIYGRIRGKEKSRFLLGLGDDFAFMTSNLRRIPNFMSVDVFIVKMLNRLQKRLIGFDKLIDSFFPVFALVDSADDLFCFLCFDRTNDHHAIAVC